MKMMSPNLQRNLALAVALLLAGSLQAQNKVTYQGQPGSKVKIEGTSNIHDWTVEGMIIAGTMELDEALLKDPKPGKINATAKVSIPVRTLKSGKPRIDEVMQEHMNMAKFKNIEYTLTELVLKEPPKSAGGPFVLESKGDLPVSGLTKKITMPVPITKVGPDKCKASGSISLKMNQYNIKPPNANIPGMAQTTTGDDVKVSVDWMTGPKK